MMRLTEDRLRTIVIEAVYPELDGGRYPVKRIVGETFEVWADIFAEGHDVLAAALKYRPKQETRWREAPMTFFDNDRWRGSFRLEQIGRYVYTIEAWRDDFESWRRNLRKKFDAGEDVASELQEGQRLIAAAAERAPEPDRSELRRWRERLAAADQAAAVVLAADGALRELMERYPDRTLASRYDRVLEVVVDREQAQFAAWYEMFHRSQGTDPTRSATFRECEARLPDIQAMGFDVIYLPPIHPIGITGRKGRNNALVAGPNDPGSPWAIGNAFGGHKAVNPELGTLEDFEHFVAAARARGMEVALDYAIQCSPDHPYVREHPEWFYHRPDGTIRYAENPPKKYQDIYPLNFYCDTWQALWEELKSIVLFWAERGVRIFRVDNPHTKPLPFWEWLISEVQAQYPDVIFLSEAFTRPKVMKFLAKAGFTQSYTYFTWRNHKTELIEYFTELTQWEPREYLRGNLFVNTPDILPEILQTGGRPAFKLRLVLAATLSSVYGIYNGFELCEARGFPGTEDYVDSEKYQYKVWDWDRPGNIKEYIATINRIRRENPALHLYKNLRFYEASDPNVLFYGKATPDLANVVLVAVNLDPHQTHESALRLPLHELGIGPDEPYDVCELITNTPLQWQGEVQTVRLDPQVEPAVILRVARPRHGGA